MKEQDEGSTAVASPRCEGERDSDDGAPPIALLRLADDDAERLGIANETETERSIYQRLCESLACGVMLIDGGGRVETLNPAAAELLDMHAEDIVHRSFGEVFIEHERLEEFNEAVLEAIYDGSVGHQRVATLHTASGPRTVAIATSYFRGARSSSPAGRGVVALLSDITEIERLRASEVALAHDVEDKHRELSRAYTDLEARNRDLHAVLRKIRAVRIAAAVSMLTLSLGVGAYVWSESPSGWFSAPSDDGDTRTQRVATVVKRYVAETIRVTTRLAAKQEVSVPSPLDAPVKRLYVALGQEVGAGDRLIELDVTDFEMQLRRAQGVHLQAKARVDNVTAWEQSPEATRARRAVTKARIALETSRDELATKRFLFERGLTPATRVEASEREVASRELDLESVELDLRVTLQGGQKRTAVAKLEYENANAALERMRWTLDHAVITAPVSGVVLGLGDSDALGRSELNPGTMVSAGSTLVEIGDMSGITVSGWLDEVEIGRVAIGQPVRVTGPAFPEVELNGEITDVSSRAVSSGGSRSVPKFHITAVVEELAPEDHEAIRLGMSARMEILVYENPDAILAPIPAVKRRGSRAKVLVEDAESGETREVEVRTGITTTRHIEILEGLDAGDRVIVQ